MKVNILGTKYSIFYETHDENPEFKKEKICGYCDSLMPEIHILDLFKTEGYENESKEAIQRQLNGTLRHEIIHAFLNESGLEVCSCQVEGAWSRNEEMVDWIAIQFPKILKAFKKSGCI